MTNKGAIIEARDTLEFLLNDIEWRPNSVSKKLVKRTLERLDKEVIEKVPDDLDDALKHLEEFNEIHRHYEEKFEIATEILREGLRDDSKT